LACRLVEGKRPKDAVNAISQLNDNQDITLYIAGEGPLRSELAGQESVKLLGHVAYEDMPALYRSVDAFVLPSRAEGVPRTILEAMASNIPVVVSNLEQIEPLVDKNGVTVPIGNISGFADGIKKAINKDDVNSRSRLQKEFDWETTVKQTTNILEQVVTNKRNL
jgi:glycosyltransferase involved in cell wall biosynthesis